jgi:cytochrome c-type biogenesis protein CcmH/NrfG
MAKMDAESGHCDRAVASFKKALEIAPGYPDAVAGIARCDPALAKASAH